MSLGTYLTCWWPLVCLSTVAARRNRGDGKDEMRTWSGDAGGEQAHGEVKGQGGSRIDDGISVRTNNLEIAAT